MSHESASDGRLAAGHGPAAGLAAHVPAGAACDPAPAPVAPAERIVTLDVLRGVSLLGILIVNTSVFFAPLSWMMIIDSLWTEPADRAAHFLMSWLAHGKFYVLFSMLFGLGMWLQLRRATERGGDFVLLYVRRLGVLLLMGLAHGLLLWYGDILATYAVCGVALLALRFVPDRWLLVIAGGLLLASLLPIAGLTALATLAGEGMGDTAATFRAAGEVELAAYQSTSFAVILRQRLQDWLFTTMYMLFVTPTVLAMFSLGMVIGRQRLIEDAGKHLGLWRMLALVALPVGLICNFGHAVLTSMTELTLSSMLGHVLLTLGGPLQMLGYVACVVLAMQCGVMRRLLAPVAAAGRMALSNYLLQTLVCTTLSYGYGFGWMGKSGPLAWIGVAVAVFAVQCPLSMLWLRYFRFGPVEWLWRTLTYGRLQPIRGSTADPRPRPPGPADPAGEIPGGRGRIP